MAKLDLTPNELLALAHACRIAASASEKDAAAQLSVSVKAIFTSSAKSYRDMADMLMAVAKADSAQSGDLSQKSSGHRRASPGPSSSTWPGKPTR